MGIQNKKYKGGALIYVLVILITVSLMSMIVFQVAMTNSHQAMRQEHAVRAYYVARSGAELAFETLATDPNMLIQLRDWSSPPTLVDNNIVFENGSANISVRQIKDVIQEGTKIGRTIEITSVGRLTNTNVERTVVLTFDATTIDTGFDNIFWR